MTSRPPCCTLSIKVKQSEYQVVRAKIKPKTFGHLRKNDYLYNVIIRNPISNV